MRTSMFCPNCGEMIPANRDSCEYCGYEREKVPPQVVPSKEDKAIKPRYISELKMILYLIGFFGILIILGVTLNHFNLKHKERDITLTKQEINKNKNVGVKELVTKVIDQEVKSIGIRNTIIKVGDKADDVFSILKKEDSIGQPDVVKNSAESKRLKVTHHYKVDAKVFDVVMTLPREDGPYRVHNIILKENVEQASSTVNEKDPFVSMSPAEHLRLAKEEINKYDLKNDKFGSIELAKSHLAAILPDSKEYKDVKHLELRIANIEKDIDRHAKLMAEKIMKIQRKEFADKLDTEYLKVGLNIEVSVSGNNYEVLKMKWVLFSRATVYQTINNKDFLLSLDKLEFKKVIMSDGYHYTWTLKKTKDGWK